MSAAVLCSHFAGRRWDLHRVFNGCRGSVRGSVSSVSVGYQKDMAQAPGAATGDGIPALETEVGGGKAGGRDAGVSGGEEGIKGRGAGGGVGFLGGRIAKGKRTCEEHCLEEGCLFAVNSVELQSGSSLCIFFVALRTRIASLL